MSILSVAVRAIRAGENPFTVFKTAATQAEAWGANIKKNLPTEVQSFIDDEVAVVKQGVANGVNLADTLAGPFLNDAADTVNGAFAALASTYLGPAAPIVDKVEIDAVNALRDHLIAGLHAEALALLGTRAGATTAPPQQGS